jgi:hypothetical protein
MAGLKTVCAEVKTKDVNISHFAWWPINITGKVPEDRKVDLLNSLNQVLNLHSVSI